MKFNLKNRPKRELKAYQDENGKSWEFEHWLEGFEQELRRRYNLGLGTGYYYLVKEILGEV